MKHISHYLKQFSEQDKLRNQERDSAGKKTDNKQEIKQKNGKSKDGRK